MSTVEQGRAAGKGTAFDRIPVVDIAPLFHDDAKRKAAVAREMARAASEVGFLYVRGHGISELMIERLRERAAAFFALPSEVKQQYYIGHSRAHRGYVPVGEERFYSGNAAKVDKKEAFDLSIELPEDDPDHIRGYRLLGPNQWPVEVPGFRNDVYAYYQAVLDLGRTLFQGFALALGLPERFFEKHLTKPPSQLRLLHYPASDDTATTKTDWGISPHTDYECFTILKATTPGLEVLNSEGRWIDAPPVPDAFVINIGDMLEVLTNGQFIATPHRVRNIPDERYSFPLFCSLDYDTVIESLPGFVGSDQPSRYPRYVAGDHLLAQTMKTFAYLQKLQQAGVVSLPHSEGGQAIDFGRKERDEERDTA
jgi:isopenicillin N synthase-like dioxygenase